MSENAYASKLIQLLARARVNVVANPFDNVVLQGRFDTYPKRRGMTRVKELLAGASMWLWATIRLWTPGFFHHAVEHHS